jgi:iron(II)-dependent oxidoreductase
MVESAVKTIAPEVGAQQVVADLHEVRARTHRLVAHLDDATLERVLCPIMSPLVWDLAHIAAYEDLWLAHRHAGEPLLRPDLAELYDAFETPRALRGDVELLDAPAARAYMEQVRDRVGRLILEGGVGDGNTHEMVLRHELQHTETMLQTMSLAGLLPAERRQGPSAGEATAAPGPRWIEIEAGTFEMGAGLDGFAYDNERERHPVELAAFAIARLPVSNAAWRQFQEQGGYERQELWSQQGWAWLQATEPRCDRRAGTGPDLDPVCHVSFHEAQAFAASQDARLPSEAEWERAATQPGLAAVGQVWEWTSSEFSAYPGFNAHPYREYSEVFFDHGYRVLRGGSFAAEPRVATRTFRNWDLPERRQIFAGLRLATDL